MNATNFSSIRPFFAALFLASATVWVSLPVAAETNGADTNAPDAGAQSAKSAASAIADALPKLSHSGHVTDIEEDPSDDGKKHVHVVINDGGSSNLWGDLVIPLAAITGVFGMPVLVVFVVMYFSYRRRRETLATVREYLNKGVPVPPELLSGVGSGDSAVRVDARYAKGSDLRRGFNLTSIGLAIAVALYINGPHNTTWCWGLIPMIMGIGYLISGWLQARRPSQESDIPWPPPKP